MLENHVHNNSGYLEVAASQQHILSFEVTIFTLTKLLSY